jgi:hypothetical protein
MKSFSTDLSREPSGRRGDTPTPSRAPVAAEGPDKALEQAGVTGNQAFLARGRSRDSSAPASSAASAAPPASTPAPVLPEVDAIRIVDSPMGAASGFRDIIGGADLNKPGEFNEPTTGEVANVHQVHFHLRHGGSANVGATRQVKRTVHRGTAEERLPADQPPQAGQPGQAGGVAGSRQHPDGPKTHEEIRPSADTLVVADAPGALSIFPGDYPFRYQGFFTMTVSSPPPRPVAGSQAASGPSVDIASISYYVGIEKTGDFNVPNEENVVFPIQKRDLVNGRDLP